MLWSAVSAAGTLAGQLGALHLSTTPAPASDSSASSTSPQVMERALSVLRRELAVCEELLQEEPKCKWVLLTVASLLNSLAACGQVSVLDGLDYPSLAVYRLLTCACVITACGRDHRCIKQAHLAHM